MNMSPKEYTKSSEKECYSEKSKIEDYSKARTYQNYHVEAI